MKTITKKTLLYKSGVEYANYCINHVEGCAHGCRFPCYAMMMAKRFGKIRDYEDWIEPKIVKNSLDLLSKEIPRLKHLIEVVHLCFTTDPFMFGFKEVSELSFDIIKLLNQSGIKCTALTKGILPNELKELSRENEFGISLVSLDSDFKEKYEPFTSEYNERIESLYNLHLSGFKTWVSIEPYPTPNIINQNIDDILDAISFVDKIVFGRLNYNSIVSAYKEYKDFFNTNARRVIDLCENIGKECHIKNGTISLDMKKKKAYRLMIG